MSEYIIHVRINLPSDIANALMEIVIMQARTLPKDIEFFGYEEVNNNV